MIHSKLKLDQCHGCDLFKGTTQSVPSLGNKSRPLMMVIGEAPGAQEDLEGKPFVGPAGQELQAILCGELGLTTEDLYIANLVKHRPPNNRTPTVSEVETCYQRFLSYEIDTVQPYCIVALGRCASENLMRFGRIPVVKDKLRGTTMMYGPHKVFHCWHPSYVIRQQSVSQSAYQKAHEELHTDLSTALQYAREAKLQYNGFANANFP